MDLLAHYTLRRCTNCGVIGNGYPIHTADCHRPATERIDVVPAARLEGAVEENLSLRMIIADLIEDEDPPEGTPQWYAIRNARAALRGQ